MGQVERSPTQTRPVAAALRTCLSDVPDRIRPLIAVSRGVFCAADSHRVEDDDEGAWHQKDPWVGPVGS
jgi:hypothetical protein